LDAFDRRYERDPNLAERLRAAERKNILTPEELNRPFTI
jgi:hypothetical protein